MTRDQMTNNACAPGQLN